MSFFTHTLEIATRGKGLYPFTRDVAKWVSSTDVQAGLLTLFIQHTSASLVIQENADPDVMTDITKALRAMIPNVNFKHGEGNSDAHLLSTIIGTSLTWPYRDSKLIFGTWQGVYFIELDGPRSRKVSVYV